MKPANLFIVTCLLVLLTACNSLPFRGAAPTDSTTQYPRSSMDHVIQNMVYTLAQINTLHPHQTTLQIPTSPASEHEQHVHERLWDAGYAIQQIDPARSTLPLSIDYNRQNMMAGMPFTFKVTAGAVSVSRSYKITNSGSTPLSAIRITGAQPMQMLSNDDIFSESVSAELTSIIFDTPAVSNDIVATAKDEPEQQNYYDTLQSSYSSLFAHYEDVKTATIYFGNDSMVLRDQGKRTIREVIRSIDPATDIISLIGCSSGSTAIANGNEILAKGRADRVKDEFLYAGFDENLIKDEGCWSAETFEVMPSRAVVITIKRAKR